MIQFDEHIFQMGWFNHQLGCYGFFMVLCGVFLWKWKKQRCALRIRRKNHMGFCKICGYQSWMFDSEWWVNWRWTHTRMYMSLMYLVNDMHASCTWLVPCLLLYVMYLFSWQTCWYCESKGICIHTSYSMYTNTFIYTKNSSTCHHKTRATSTYHPTEVRSHIDRWPTTTSLATLRRPGDVLLRVRKYALGVFNGDGKITKTSNRSRFALQKFPHCNLVKPQRKKNKTI